MFRASGRSVSFVSHPIGLAWPPAPILDNDIKQQPALLTPQRMSKRMMVFSTSYRGLIRHVPKEGEHSHGIPEVYINEM